MDISALGITAGIFGVAIFAIIKAIRQRTFDAGNSFLIFGAIFAVTGGIRLIATALVGNEKKLPYFWREYLAVAAVIGIGLSFQFVIKAFRSAWVKSGKPTQFDDQIVKEKEKNKIHFKD